VRWRTGLVGLLVLLVAGWAVLAVMSTEGPDPHEFRAAAAKSAQGALSAVRTALLVGRAEVSGRAVQTYTTPVLDNAVEGVATAQERLAQTPAPGTAEGAVRDELARLLDDAARSLGALVAALDGGDDGATRTALDALGQVGDRLDGFVQEHRP
jgi:hypothetical protein